MRKVEIEKEERERESVSLGAYSVSLYERKGVCSQVAHWSGGRIIQWVVSL